MATTHFVDNTTVVPASWLNDVDNHVYGDTTNVKNAPYNAVGDGVTDDTAAIQAAIDSGSLNLYFPDGTYKITSTLVIPNTGGMIWRGEGKTTTILKGSGTITVLVRIGDGTPGVANGTAQVIRGAFSDMCFSGEGATVQYGLYGQRVEEHDFTRCWFRNCTVAGASIGYGYVNNYYQCEFSYNTGDGLVLNTDFNAANNANHLAGCLLFDNTGWGLKAKGGAGLYIDGCTIEQNDKGGIFINTIRAFKCSAYFESNGVTGHTFTTPSVTVKADILICGSSTETDMGAAFPSTGCVIDGCTTVPLATSNAFVWNAGAVDLSVRNCRTTNASYVPVVAEHYNPTYKGENISIDACSSFTTPLSITGASAAVNNTFAAYYRIEDPAAKEVILRNYVQQDLNQWAELSAGSAYTYRRSNNASIRKLHGCDVWEILTAATSSSGIVGVSCTATDYPELVGKPMWYGVWVYATASDCYAVPYCDEQTFNNNPTTLNTWVFLAVSFTWPASGTVDVGIYKTGAATTGSIYFAAPMLTVIGVQHDDCIGIIQQPPKQWSGTAAPTVGRWDDGDIVWNTAPAAAGAPGWVCTTPGAQGTFVFKAMANLAV